MAGWVAAGVLVGWLAGLPKSGFESHLRAQPPYLKNRAERPPIFLEDLCLRERRDLGQCMVTFVCVCFFSSLSVIFDDFW